ncbi:geminin coiled-coil domain-containing protein 1 isoform X2 [Betta splendens]|uniref:Geminin coiled-coil domain-containing protein 1 isoform X2 n=1 Tax=Betta splendens TaxID=158456 RepID=A0A6P7P5L5_BETSP|nr:geminin coiled-coil domain-containing protein 1 isoform X2 [Betta splendens]
MATLAAVWAHDPRDLSERQHEPLTVWESQSVCNSPSPAGVTWMEQLSPQLQRNKQLQDTLLQREEELARLQEENNKLREFLKSSFVRDLEKKAKIVDPRQVSKRVCRNLTAEFCSEFHEDAAPAKSNLDLWVLRTLGLKDRDTIDTSNEPGSNLRLGYDSAVISSSEHTLSSLSPSVATSSPLPAHNNYCHNTTQQTGYQYEAECQEATCNFTSSPGQHCDFTASGLTGQYEVPRVVTGSYSTAFQPQLPFSQSPDPNPCSTTASSPAQRLQGNQAELTAYWPPLQGSQTPSRDTVVPSPLRDTIQSSSTLMSSPVTNGQVVVRGCSPSIEPPTPCQRTDLAFSMSLSPSSSVKTHSFPQGQAFIRKDSEGRWNFTWVPRQGP